MRHQLDRIPFVKLSNLPTPLERAPRLAEFIGLSELYIKRDDLTGFAGGGNKSRKLEYDFANILAKKHDVVITAGGIQSNHARMTAAAARKFGLDVKLVLGGPDFHFPRGNLLLDSLFDAEIRYIVNDDANERLTNEMQSWSDELSSSGFNPYIIPIGGSTGLGALGYVKAMKELSAQLGQQKVQIILAVGSCGTFAGTILGSEIFMPGTRIIGISVSRTTKAIQKRTREIIGESADLINYKTYVSNYEIEVYDDYFVEYGCLTKEGEQAISVCANLEGLLVDPVYTAKVMAALFDLDGKNILDATIPVVFIHTGGIPIIFSFEQELGSKIRCTKIRS